jgi:threonine/homoserine/homoserine lactone efflux protein
VVLTGMIVLICSTWLLVGASLARSLRDPRTSRIVNVALAVALVAFTIPAAIH